jgi:cytochrome oxidase Cu insertion factor (SCO1/SenC/PrrC family)
VNQDSRRKAGRWKLFAVLAVCAAPVVASYLYYYVIQPYYGNPPENRTNYGSLLDPRDYPMPARGISSLDGKAFMLDAYKGKWIMLQADASDCRDGCRNKLLQMRQLRLMQGKNMDRIERVWLITDEQPVETMLMREYDGTRLLRVKPDALTTWLPTQSGTVVADHIYLIDPLGNLMMRFPKNADPNKIKKDLAKLLKASSIG